MVTAAHASDPVGALTFATTLPEEFISRVQQFGLFPHVTVNGAASVEQLIHLPKNGVVEPPYIVTVRAGRADWTLASNVGKLRTQNNSSASQQRTSVVVDFGVLRTVAGIAITDATKWTVIQVKSWTGVGFGAKAVFADPTAGDGLVITPTSTDVSITARAVVDFPSEIKTERLQIDLVGTATDTDLATNLLVHLPDEPSDLDLRINGGAPVWSAPGPVTAGTGGWIADTGAGADLSLSHQTVDLSAALTALLSDPSALPTDLVDLHLVLSARVPGALALELPAAGAQVIHHITQVTFEQGTRDLVFTDEGLASVSLAMPAWAKKVARLQLGVSAKLPATRVRPAIGPDPATITQNGITKSLAELILDPDHAAAAAIPASLANDGWHRAGVLVNHGGLVQLTGVRLPVRADVDGAEARAVLFTNVDDEPGAPLDAGTSKPVTIDAPANDDVVWTTFTFATPIKIDSTALPFVGINVSRGNLTWALTASLDGGQLWRGPPTGPLQELPTLGALASLHGPFRLIGIAAADRPVAPLLMDLGGATGGLIEVTPTPKGIVVEIEPDALLDIVQPGGATLEVISHVPGTVTIRDVFAIVTSS